MATVFFSSSSKQNNAPNYYLGSIFYNYEIYQLEIRKHISSLFMF